MVVLFVPLQGFQRLRPRGRSGLKLISSSLFACTTSSPSSRAEWVEITFTHDTAVEKMSPSSRAEWVEMPVSCNNHWHIASPSSWAEWVEIW